MFKVSLTDTEPLDVIYFANNASLWFPTNPNSFMEAGISLNVGEIYQRPLSTVGTYKIWNRTFIDNQTFYLTPGYNPSVALTSNSTTFKLNVSKVNHSDYNQQWSIISGVYPCNNNCSEHGVCAYTTGI